MQFSSRTPLNRCTCGTMPHRLIRQSVAQCFNGHLAYDQTEPSILSTWSRSSTSRARDEPVPQMPVAIPTKKTGARSSALLFPCKSRGSSTDRARSSRRLLRRSSDPEIKLSHGHMSYVERRVPELVKPAEDAVGISLSVR